MTKHYNEKGQVWIPCSTHRLGLDNNISYIKSWCGCSIKFFSSQEILHRVSYYSVVAWVIRVFFIETTLQSVSWIAVIYHLTKTPAHSHIMSDNTFICFQQGFFLSSQRHILFSLYISCFIYMYIYNIYIETKISVHFCWIRLKNISKGQCKPWTI